MRALELLELESWLIVSHHGILGTEFWSFLRAANARNY